METTIPSNRWSKLSRTYCFEQEQGKDVIDSKKREIENMEIHEVYECVPDMG